jgi:hypothetical protein
MFALGRKVRTFERVWKWKTWHIFLSLYMLKNIKYLEHWSWFIGFPHFLTPKKYPKQVTAPMDTLWVWQTQGRPPPWAAGREGFGHLDARPSGTNWPTWNRSCSVKTIAAVISQDCSPIFWVQDLFLWVIAMKPGILSFFFNKTCAPNSGDSTVSSSWPRLQDARLKSKNRAYPTKKKHF